MIPRQAPSSTGALIRSADRRSTNVLISAPVLGILFVYFGSKPFYFQHLASSFVLGGNTELTAGLFTFSSAFFLFGLIPALIVKLVFREGSTTGGLGESFGWKAFAVVAPVMVLLSLSASRMPEFLASTR